MLLRVSRTRTSEPYLDRQTSQSISCISQVHAACQVKSFHLQKNRRLLRVPCYRRSRSTVSERPLKPLTDIAAVVSNVPSPLSDWLCRYLLLVLNKRTNMWSAHQRCMQCSASLHAVGSLPSHGRFCCKSAAILTGLVVDDSVTTRTCHDKGM